MESADMFMVDAGDSLSEAQNKYALLGQTLIRQLNWINDDIKEKAAWMAIAVQKCLIRVAEKVPSYRMGYMFRNA